VKTFKDFLIVMKNIMINEYRIDIS